MIDDLIPGSAGGDSPLPFLDGVISRVDSDGVFVVADGFSGEHEFGPCNYSPIPGAPPQEGDAVLIYAPETAGAYGVCWIVSYQPQVTPGGHRAGDMKIAAHGTLDDGWLWCDGASYLRSDYYSLFTKLGGGASPWGLPDGTHFNVPDLRGRTLFGKGSHANVDALGDNDGLSANDRQPRHKHSVGSLVTGAPVGYPNFNVYSAGGGSNFVVHTWGGNFVGGDASKYNDISHSHAITGKAGDATSNVEDQIPHAVVNIAIKT